MCQFSLIPTFDSDCAALFKLTFNFFSPTNFHARCLLLHKHFVQAWAHFLSKFRTHNFSIDGSKLSISKLPVRFASCVSNFVFFQFHYIFSPSNLLLRDDSTDSTYANVRSYFLWRGARWGNLNTFGEFHGKIQNRKEILGVGKSFKTHLDPTSLPPCQENSKLFCVFLNTKLSSSSKWIFFSSTRHVAQKNKSEEQTNFFCFDKKKKKEFKLKLLPFRYFQLGFDSGKVPRLFVVCRVDVAATLPLYLQTRRHDVWIPDTFIRCVPCNSVRVCRTIFSTLWMPSCHRERKMFVSRTHI